MPTFLDNNGFRDLEIEGFPQNADIKAVVIATNIIQGKLSNLKESDYEWIQTLARASSKSCFNMLHNGISMIDTYKILK